MQPPTYSSPITGTILAENFITPSAARSEEKSTAAVTAAAANEHMYRGRGVCAESASDSAPDWLMLPMNIAAPRQHTAYAAAGHFAPMPFSMYSIGPLADWGYFSPNSAPMRFSE